MVCAGPGCVSILNVPGLDSPVKFVRGVGPHVSEMLAAKGIQTAEDLLYHLPFRYEDRQNPRSLDELKPGETASVIAEVRGAASVAHPPHAALRTHRGPGPACAQVHLVSCHLSRRQVPCRADRGSLRQDRAFTLHQQLQDDPAAVRDPARLERRCRDTLARSRPHHAGV